MSMKPLLSAAGRQATTGSREEELDYGDDSVGEDARAKSAASARSKSSASSGPFLDVEILSPVPPRKTSDGTVSESDVSSAPRLQIYSPSPDCSSPDLKTTSEHANSPCGRRSKKTSLNPEVVSPFPVNPATHLYLDSKRQKEQATIEVLDYDDDITVVSSERDGKPATPDSDIEFMGSTSLIDYSCRGSTKSRSESRGEKTGSNCSRNSSVSVKSVRESESIVDDSDEILFLDEIPGKNYTVENTTLPIAVKHEEREREVIEITESPKRSVQPVPNTQTSDCTSHCGSTQNFFVAKHPAIPEQKAGGWTDLLSAAARQYMEKKKQDEKSTAVEELDYGSDEDVCMLKIVTSPDLVELPHTSSASTPSPVKLQTYTSVICKSSENSHIPTLSVAIKPVVAPNQEDVCDANVTPTDRESIVMSDLGLQYLRAQNNKRSEEEIVLDYGDDDEDEIVQPNEGSFRDVGRRSACSEQEPEKMEVAVGEISAIGRRYLDAQAVKSGTGEEQLDYGLEEDELIEVDRHSATVAADRCFAKETDLGMDVVIPPFEIISHIPVDGIETRVEPAYSDSPCSGYDIRSHNDAVPKDPSFALRHCHLAYFELAGYPNNIRSTYSFLRCAGKKLQPDPHNHQFLHLCHDGPELLLLKTLQNLLSTDFDYKKAVIFARRDERLKDIQRALKLCSLDSYRIRMGLPLLKMIGKFEKFEKMMKRILVCSCRVLPPSKALVNADLLIWWNLPWSVQDFLTIKSRLSSRTILLVLIKQEGDWQFLKLRKDDQGIIFPELNLQSEDESRAGFINSRFTCRK